MISVVSVFCVNIRYVILLARGSILFHVVSPCGLASLPITDIIERNSCDRRVNDREIGGDQRDR